jgi:GT2 family glycosyltransferase
MCSREKVYPLVSVITVNYNNNGVTEGLLTSLKKISYPHFETIVVDNASPDANPDLLKNKFPEIQLIKSQRNLGFAGGNNLGIHAAKGKYLLFINNDTEVPADFLEPLIEILESNYSIGMVSPKIKFHWNPELIQYAGYTKMNPYTIRNNSIGYHQKDSEKYNTPGETNAAHGAAMMVPKKVIEEVGVMPEVYFLYYEEHDWAEMIKRVGYKVFYQPKSFILHKESISTGRDSPMKTYYLARNRLIFSRRNYTGFTQIISVLFQLLFSWPKNTLKFLLKGQIKYLKAYWKGILWNFTHYNNIKNNPKPMSK